MKQNALTNFANRLVALTSSLKWDSLQGLSSTISDCGKIVDSYTTVYTRLQTLVQNGTGVDDVTSSERLMLINTSIKNQVASIMTKLSSEVEEKFRMLNPKAIPCLPEYMMSIESNAMLRRFFTIGGEVLAYASPVTTKALSFLVHMTTGGLIICGYQPGGSTDTPYFNVAVPFGYNSVCNLYTDGPIGSTQVRVVGNVATEAIPVPIQWGSYKTFYPGEADDAEFKRTFDDYNEFGYADLQYGWDARFNAFLTISGMDELHPGFASNPNLCAICKISTVVMDFLLRRFNYRGVSVTVKTLEEVDTGNLTTNVSGPLLSFSKEQSLLSSVTFTLKSILQKLEVDLSTE